MSICDHGRHLHSLPVTSIYWPTCALPIHFYFSLKCDLNWINRNQQSLQLSRIFVVLPHSCFCFKRCQTLDGVKLTPNIRGGLRSVSLYGKRILGLPITSLVEEYNCRLKACSGAPVVKTRRKWNPREPAQRTQRALEHRYVVGQVQKVRTGLGSGDMWNSWAKATVLERRKMVISNIRQQGEWDRNIWAGLLCTAH